jgi:hypothetical protein
MLLMVIVTLLHLHRYIATWSLLHCYMVIVTLLPPKDALQFSVMVAFLRFNYLESVEDHYRGRVDETASPERVESHILLIFHRTVNS